MKGLPAPVAAALAICLLACGGGTQAQVDPAQTLRDAGTAMSKVTTLNATLKFTKGAITFQGFTLVSAQTAVRLPGDSDTVYTVKEQDLAIGLEIVIAAGHVYLHLPFSPFQELTGQQGAAVPDLAKLFAPDTGLPTVIPAGRNLGYAGADKVDGVDTQKINATYSTAQVHGMLGQLTSSGDVRAVIWVDVGDHLIRKATLDGAFGDGGKEAAVEVDISGFNSTVKITSPSP